MSLDVLTFKLAVRSISLGSRPMRWHHSSRIPDLRAYSSGSPSAFHICACSATSRRVTFSPPPPSPRLAQCISHLHDKTCKCFSAKCGESWSIPSSKTDTHHYQIYETEP